MIKLTLNKETIRNLAREELPAIRGGNVRQVREFPPPDALSVIRPGTGFDDTGHSWNPFESCFTCYELCPSS